MELNKAQIQAIKCIDDNLQIVACAGSGKTEVISRRIASILLEKKDIQPENIVAFTFTNFAAENMRKRISSILKEFSVDIDCSGMYIGTIHSFCKLILDKYVEQFKDFKILDSAKQHLFMMKYYNISGAKDLGLYKKQYDLFSTCIDKMVVLHERYDEWPIKIRDVFDQYRKLLYDKKFLDFSFLIFEVLQHVEIDNIKDYFSSIKYLIVDEYQDVDDLQEKLINEISLNGANICVVGDDDQTIYQFRGSNADNMIGFSNRYKDVETVNLEVNYRSEKAIIDVADTVIQNNDNRLVKRMLVRPDASIGEIHGYCLKGKEEYVQLANDVCSLQEKGVSYSDMAVLIRSRKYLNEIIDAFDLYEIPYQAEINEAFFVSDYYDKFCNIFIYLQDESSEKRQNIINDWKDLTAARDLKTALRELSRSKENNEHFSKLFRAFINNLNLSIQELVGKYIDAFESILNDFDQVYNKDSWTVRTNELVYYIENILENEYKRVNLFEEKTDDAVKIMTVHKSKGLEFKAVFIPDLQEGIFPSQKRGGQKYYSILGGLFEEEKERFESTIEDERKLFYVALTRAQEYLYVYANTEKKEASRFMREMNESPYCSIDIKDPDKKKTVNRGTRIRRSFPSSDGDYDLADYSSTEEYLRAREEGERVKADRKEQQRERELQHEYWNNVKHAKKRLYDFYGSAAQCFPAAYVELSKIKNMHPDEILSEARKQGLI